MKQCRDILIIISNYNPFFLSRMLVQLNINSITVIFMTAPVKKNKTINENKCKVQSLPSTSSYSMLTNGLKWLLQFKKNCWTDCRFTKSIRCLLGIIYLRLLSWHIHIMSLADWEATWATIAGVIYCTWRRLITFSSYLFNISIPLGAKREIT